VALGRVRATPTPTPRKPRKAAAPATATFFTRRTDLPDVYELYETLADVTDVACAPAGLACVPTLDCSRALRALFDNRGTGYVVRLCYTLHPTFAKWVPQI
jgi:hypothetical protein